MKYKLIYTKGESFSNFANIEHAELFDSANEAFEYADIHYPPKII